MIREIETGDYDMGNVVKNLISDDYTVINMFMSEPENDISILRVILRKEDEIVSVSNKINGKRYSSISSDIPCLEIYERSIMERNGVDIVDLKNTTPVTYWRKGNPPLSKISGKEEERIPVPHNDIRGDGIFEIPVGPVHAGVIEPGHFRFSVAGEQVIKLCVHLGYVHRNIEKLLEGEFNKTHLHLVERISGDTAIANAISYCHIAESNIDVPERAGYIRVIAAELERLYNHMAAIGGMCTDTAFSVLSARALRLQEDVLRLCNSTFGDRYMRNVVIPGGVRKDISDDKIRHLERSLIELKLDCKNLFEKMMESSTLMDRLETTGILSYDAVSTFGAVGPIGRASGLNSDVRCEKPYDGYKTLKVLIASEVEGDVLARTKVRMREVFESIDLIFQAIGRMKPGPLKCEIPTQKDGLIISVVEAPRGELIHCVDIRNGKIWRYSIRDPSFVNWPMMSFAVPGNVVPDFPLINKSFSLSYSGNDL